MSNSTAHIGNVAIMSILYTNNCPFHLCHHTLFGMHMVHLYPCCRKQHICLPKIIFRHLPYHGKTNRTILTTEDSKCCFVIEQLKVEIVLSLAYSSKTLNFIFVVFLQFFEKGCELLPRYITFSITESVKCEQF